MANRNLNPVYFGNVTYDSLNEDKRWKLIATSDDGAGNDIPFVSDVEKATAIRVLTGGQSHAGAVYTDKFHQVDNLTPITIAFRLPQTKKILNLIADMATTDVQYSVFLSGRSDKKYSELVDWVKVADSTGEHLESTPHEWLPAQTRISSLDGTGLSVGLGALKNNATLEINTDDTTPTWISRGPLPVAANMRHCRFFPFTASWIKLEIYTGDTITAVDLSRIFINDYTEDIQSASTEHAPEIEMVYPLDGKDWLPSQSIYATARITEPDNDNCHFGFEIYKESAALSSGWSGVATDQGVFGTSAGDHLLHVVESNKFNLDGTVNENNTRSWKALGITAADSINTILVPELGLRGTGVKAILVVPIEVADKGTTASMGNIKFYQNAGNVLKLDTLVGPLAAGATPQPFADITVPTTKEGRSTATGWVIELENPIQGIDRIDFLNSSTGSKVVTKVEIYYLDTDPGIDLVQDQVEVVNGVTVWRPDNTTSAFQTDEFIANIEFCYPETDTEHLVGYKEGTRIANGELVQEANGDYDPANNGVGVGEGITARSGNQGEWGTVPKHAGLMLGPATEGTGPVNYILGDSPITVDNYVATGKTGDPAKNSVYIRIPLPDPYKDGERYYARAYVWDGRTKSVT